MKRYIMFFISIGLILGIILFYKVMSIDENRKVVFNESGYILNGETDRYYFNQEEKYTTTYNDKIVFNDTEGAKVTVDNDNFVHYQSGNIEGLKDGVLLDLGKIDDDLIVYYNIKATKEVKKVSDRYIVKNLENDLQFDQAIWKISANKYIILGRSIKFKLDDGTEKEVNGYVEIEFFEDEISNVNSEKGKINIYNQEISYMTSIKDDKYIELSDDIKLNIGTKVISKKGQNKMSLEDMVINSNDNVTLVDIDEKEENTVEENKVDENTTENNTENNNSNTNNNNNNNSSSTTNNNNTNNSTTGGTTNNSGSTSTINIDTPDIKYVESNGTDTKIDSSKVVKEPKFRLENMNVTAMGIEGNIKIIDEDDLLSKEDDMNIKIVNNSTGKVVYNENQAYGNSFDIPIKCETLLPDTQYTIAVTATYMVNNTVYTKNFIYKTFSTSSIGINIRKSGYTDHSLSFDVSISDELFNSAQVYLLDINGNNIKDSSGKSIYKAIDNRTKTVTFDNNLNSNTQYKIKVADIKYSGTSQTGSNWEINYDDCLTLKKLPDIKKLNYAIDKREGKFKLNIEKIEDVDNAAQSYTYVVYEFNENTKEFNTDKPAYKKETKEKEITIDVEDETKAGDGDLIRGKAYGYKVIINSYDNEKYIETISDICGTFTMTAKEFPTIEFKENKITATSIRGTLYIHDDEKTITCDKDNKLTIKWKNSLGEEGILNEYTTTASLDDIRKGDAGLPISMDGLKANETYTISVYGTVDLRSDNSDTTNIFKNVLIGSQFVTTSEYKALTTNYSADQNPNEAFALNIKLEGEEFEKESLNSITFFLQAGSTFDKDQSYEKLTITDRTAANYGADGLKELFETNKGFKLKPSMFNNKNYTAKKYIILTTITIDGTEYKNKIPITCDNKDEEGLKAGQNPDPYEDSGEKYSATYVVIDSKKEAPNTKQLLTVVPQYYREGEKENYSSTTIKGYKVGLNWGNSGYDPSEVASITYHVSYARDKDTWAQVRDSGKNLEITKEGDNVNDDIQFEVKDGTPSAIKNSIDTSIESDNKDGLHRGGAYYFWCTIKLTSGEVFYETEEQFKTSATLYKPTKQEPTVIIYPYNSGDQTMEFKYTIVDIDKTMETNSDSTPIFYVYNQDNAYIDASTNYFNDRNTIAFSNAFTDTNEYTIKYKKITDKTNATQFEKEYSTITQKYEKIIDKNEMNNNVGYSAEYNQENPNKIKVFLNGEYQYLNKIAAAKATIKNESTNVSETTSILPIKYDGNYYIEIDMMKLSNPINFIGGNTINVTLYYDTNQIGFQEKTEETEQYVTYVRSDDNYTYEVFEKDAGINNIRGNIYKLNKFSEITLGIDIEDIYGAQLATIELQPTYQGLKYNGNTIVQKKIGSIEKTGKTFNIPRVIAGIELPKENIKTDFTTARLTPILTKYGLDIDKIYAKVYKEGETDPVITKEIDMKGKDEIGEIEFTGLDIATKYKVKFTYRLSNETEEYEMYGMDQNKLSPEYEFDTIATIGIQNVNIEYDAKSYTDKTLRVTYDIDENVFDKYKKTKYSFYKKGDTTPVKIALKGSTDVNDLADYVIVENDENNYYNGDKSKRILELNVNPEFNKFDFGKEYIIKIVPIAEPESSEIEIETFTYEQEAITLEPVKFGVRMIRADKVSNTDNDKIKINISAVDNSHLIVNDNYTIQIKRYEEGNNIGEDITSSVVSNSTISINETNFTASIENVDYIRYKYEVKILYELDAKNNGAKLSKESTYELDRLKSDIELGQTTIEKDTDGNVNLICDECYEVKKANYAKYTIYEGENKYRSTGIFKIDGTNIKWTRDGTNEDVVRYILNLPLTEITKDEEDYYYIELELYIGDPDNEGKTVGRVSGYCKIKKAE